MQVSHVRIGSERRPHPRGWVRSTAGVDQRPALVSTHASGGAWKHCPGPRKPSPEARRRRPRHGQVKGVRLEVDNHLQGGDSAASARGSSLPVAPGRVMWSSARAGPGRTSRGPCRRGRRRDHRRGLRGGRSGSANRRSGVDRHGEPPAAASAAGPTFETDRDGVPADHPRVRRCRRSGTASRTPVAPPRPTGAS
jgi:hypothetical protein